MTPAGPGDRATERPLVSVVVPTYNQAGFIGDSLRSVLAQTYAPIEIVVVDDGSTDDTEAVVAGFADAGVRYVRQPSNRGAPSAQNAGLGLTTGRYVSMFDSDDLMLPENVAQKVAVFERHPSVGLVSSNAEMIDESGRPLGLKRPRDRSALIPRDRFSASLLFGNPLVSSSVMLRRECYEVVGGFDEEIRHAYDWDMWLRVATRYDACHLARPLLRHRLHRRSLRQVNFSENLDLAAMRRLVDRAAERSQLSTHGLSREEVYWANYFRMLHNKVGVVPPRDVLQLYLAGLRRHPRRLVRPQDALLLLKVAADVVLPDAARSRVTDWKLQRRHGVPGRT